MIVRLKRAQIRRGQAGLDITVKSAVGGARNFAPSWRMVLDHKDGRINDREYTEIDDKLLRTLDVLPFRWLWQQGLNNGGELTLLCYCREGWFCHTHILIDYGVSRWPKAFADGRGE